MATATSSTTIQYGNQVPAKDRELRGAQNLAAKYGNIDYDRNVIEGVFGNAVKAEYDAKDKAYARTAGQYTDRLAQSQNAYLDAMRKNAAASAVQGGANAGMTAANSVSAMLGMSQQTATDNLTLAQEARALADQRAAAEAKALRDALQYSNEQKLALGTLGSNIYATDAQKYVGELGADAQITAANTAASAQGYNADRQLEGTQYNADKNLEGTVYNADKNLEGTQYTANKNYDGTVYNANKNYDGTVYSSDKNYAATTTAARTNAGAQIKAAQLSKEGQEAYANAVQNSAVAQANANVNIAEMNMMTEKYGVDAEVAMNKASNIASVVNNMSSLKAETNPKAFSNTSVIDQLKTFQVTAYGSTANAIDKTK